MNEIKNILSKVKTTKEDRELLKNILNTEELNLDEKEILIINGRYSYVYFENVNEVSIFFIKNIFKNNLNIEISSKNLNKVSLEFKDKVSDLIIDIEEKKEESKKYNKDIINYIAFFNKNAFDYFNIFKNINYNEEISKLINIMSEEQQDINVLIVKKVINWSNRMLAELVYVALKRNLNGILENIPMSKGVIQGMEHSIDSNINLKGLILCMEHILTNLNQSDPWIVLKLNDLMLKIIEKNNLVFEKINTEYQLKNF